MTTKVPHRVIAKANLKKANLTKNLIDYINYSGCRNAFLDAEYGNPERPDDPPCTSCDNCLAKQATSIAISRTTASESGNSSKETITSPTSGEEKIVWLTPAERKDCEIALRKWRRAKWESSECVTMDIKESYILPDKFLTSIARHPCVKTILDLKKTSYVWPHHERWGEEIVLIMKKIQKEREDVRLRKEHQVALKKFVQDRWARREAAEKAAKKAERTRKSNEKKQAREARAAERNQKSMAAANARIAEDEARKNFKKEEEEGVRAGEIFEQEQMKGNGRQRKAKTVKTKAEGGERVFQSNWERLDELSIRLPRGEPSSSTRRQSQKSK